ncbi:hypothetical protein BC937DRAFT_86201 [Endogone sp. FLAS-F59071]|nr:hypothetical protein BC937DRAFT_86201 [Endogone sp. FLAS-F59071]|eukprot:RUS13179.1 hypothetical protein BC937DRAFT_86201 [Endogone sp. FLAS-F59071]
MSTWSFQQMSDATLERLSRASHAKMYPSPDPFTKGKTETPLRKLLLVSRLWNAVRRHQSYRAWSSPPMLSPPTMPQQLPQPEELPSSDAMPQDLELMLQNTGGFEEVVAEQDPGFYIPPRISQPPVVGREGVFSLHSLPAPSDPVMDVTGMSTHQNQSSGPEILFIQEFPGQDDYYLLSQNSDMPVDDKQQLGGLAPTTTDLSQIFNVATMTANGDGMTTTTAAAMLSQPGLGLIAAVPLGTSPPTPTTLLDHSQIVFQIPVDNPQRRMSSSLSNYNNTLSVQSAVAAPAVTPAATPAAAVAMKQERDLDSVTNNAVEEASSAALDDEDVEEEKSSLNNATSCTDTYTAPSAQDTATVMAKDNVEAMPKKRSVDDVDGYYVSEKPAKRASPTKEKDNGVNNRNIVSSYSLRSKRKSSNGSGSVSPSKQQTARNPSVTVASLASASEPSQAQAAAMAMAPPPVGADVAKRIERGIERLSLEPELHTDDSQVISTDFYDDYANSSARKRRIDDVDDQAVPDKLPKNPSPAHDLQGDNITGPGAAAAAAARITSSYSLRSRNRSSAAPTLSPTKQSRNPDFTDPSPPPSPAPHIAIPTLQRRPSSPLAIEEPTIPRTIDMSYREHAPRRSPATASAARRNSESSGNGSSAGGSTGGSPPSPGPASPGPVLISA